jgi:sarcosine oxidase
VYYDSFDTIVLGAGAMGSAAAYHLARDGRHILLLEQFAIAHNRGSSHGESRIFRYAYSEPAYARLAIQSKPLWRALEADAGEPLLREIGGLDIGETAVGRKEVLAVAATLQATGSCWEQLERSALASRYPQWHLGDEAIAVYSPDTGVLNPTRCVQVMVGCAIAYGATVRDQEPAMQISPHDDGVEVTTTRDRYRAAHLIITCGAWTNRVLRDLGRELPLRVSQEQVVYFRPRANVASFMPDRFPIWIHHREETTYGFPILGAPGIKIGFHHDGFYLDVENYTQEPRPGVTERLRAYLEQYLPDAAGEPFDPSTCLYTNTPDENFIVDTLPGRPHIAIGAGFSGHGFKFAIAIGRALADLVERGETKVEVGHLGMGRLSLIP